MRGACWLLPSLVLLVSRCSDGVHRAIAAGCGDGCTVASPETDEWQSVLLNDSTAVVFG